METTCRARRAHLGAALAISIAFFAGPPVETAAELPFELAVEYSARDTLAAGEEPSGDARRCLENLVWPPAAFAVRCELPQQPYGDVLVRFPSPVDTGNAVNDRVAIEWYVARDGKRAAKARAIIVVHESGRAMPVGRLIARGMRLQGLHAFLVQLPGYGVRRKDGEDSNPADLVAVTRQAVADVRRARDAVAALPCVDGSHIALQGTSLGGFVASLAGSLDSGYDSVFLMLAGGDLYDVLQNGEKDTANARQRLAEAGLSGEKLKAAISAIEPLHLAHRLRPERTWLFSGVYDTVVPLKNATALAEAARLDPQHHVQMLADHYSGIVFLPSILTQMHEEIAGRKKSGVISGRES